MNKPRRHHSFLNYSCAILMTGAFGLSFTPQQGMAASDQSTHSIQINQQERISQPRIQLAILLDTSSSMDGLINQARNQLWQAVNEFSKARMDGIIPTLEVAVYEYGNNNLPVQNSYVRQVVGLTRDLDQVSEALFSLTTNGGDEFCGLAINTAVTDLQWSTVDRDIKAIFIAGNEAFTQGPLPFKTAIAAAKSSGITVNTIHAGNYEQGANSGWREGALLAGGNYMSINHNHQVAHVIAPQDQRIAELNTQLNQTYIPYGPKGGQGQKRQQEQDAQSKNISMGLLAQRVKSKASTLYDSAGWDLVDAQTTGAATLEELEEEQLPAKMRSMDMEEKKQHIQKKTEERKRIKAEIASLAKERETYVAEQKRKTDKAVEATINDALVGTIREQGAKKRYIFQSE